ncbi:MAG: hypothetical protein SOT91_04085 [Bacilli bacterium]|nr:hypothetical protein [Bacilli bacterium]
METIALLFLFGIFIILSYTLGLKNGQKLKNDEEIKIPEINPVKIVRNEIETFEQKKKQDAYDTMMANIDNYDGTGLGQKDIPS